MKLHVLMRNTAYFVLLVAAAAAHAAPSISPGRILNAASYSGSIAPGSIATLFGDFGVTPAQVFSGAWPSTLSGLSVQFTNRLAAPIYYVSPSQIIVQAPWELAGPTAVTVTAGGQTSAAQDVAVAPFSPGIFSMNGQGTGQGAIVDAFTYQLADTASPAGAGTSYVQIYCTGLGPVTNQPQTGATATAHPLSATTVNPNARYLEAQLGALANGGRNTLATTPINNFDVSLTKHFNITESKRFEFGGQFSMYSIAHRRRRVPSTT